MATMRVLASMVFVVSIDQVSALQVAMDAERLLVVLAETCQVLQV